MSNLDDFKVEELEQRLEMAKWSAGASASNENGGTIKADVRVTW